MLKVSVIIATYNCESEIEKTIKSFNSQTYRNKELIVIDGGSKDGTVKIIKRYKKNIAYWVSEPDKGISEAFNKGVKAAKGDFLYFIGAGDYFWSDSVLKKVMDGINPNSDMLVCGRINRMNEKGDEILYTSTLNLRKWMMIYKMGYPHQGLFTNRKFFEKYGMFDLNCKYAMDYDLLLRAYKTFPRVIMKDLVVAAWKAGGVGKGKTMNVLDEYNRIRIKNKIEPVFVLNLIYLISKLRYKIWNE